MICWPRHRSLDATTDEAASARGALWIADRGGAAGACDVLHATCHGVRLAVGGCGGARHGPGLLVVPQRLSVPDPVYREAVSAFYTGLAALQTSQEVLARQKFERVTTIVPDEPAAWANLGLLMVGSRRSTAHCRSWARPRTRADQWRHPAHAGPCRKPAWQSLRSHQALVPRDRARSRRYQVGVRARTGDRASGRR